MSDAIRIILIVAAAAIAVTLLVFLGIAAYKVIARVVRHLWRFVSAEVGDAVRAAGSVVTSVFYALFIVANVVVGRWSAARHYARGIAQESRSFGRAVYRICIGNPARLFLLAGLVEGVEDRLPAMVQAAPGSDLPKGRGGQFDGYKIIGSLAAGGSGSKLYIAEPDALRRAALERSGHKDVTKVVIKSFSLADGSSLPQIVRESRALDAAKALGLILDHDLAPERFYYVMRYVPGQNLTLVAKDLHARSPAPGLDEKHLRIALGYAADLVRTLDRYHRGGLWHKDVKPDNIIVDAHSAHLVDFGLVTPLRSAMTLTTHGTEYFRDPEMVRLALKGVKVHEVDGTRFDIFGAGAVLYAVIENSFPAHGVLSPITRACPEALRWVVRRAMTDYDKRYQSAGELLADIEHVRRAPDPFALRPVDLPSMAGVESPALAVAPPVAVPAAAPVERSVVHAGPPSSSRPRFTGDEEWSAGAQAGSPVPSMDDFGHRRPASEQVASARARALAARQRIHARFAARDGQAKPLLRGMKGPIVLFALLFVGVLLGLSFFTVRRAPMSVDPEAIATDATNTSAASDPFAALGDLQGKSAFVVSDLDALDSGAINEAREGLALLRAGGVRLAGLPVTQLLTTSDLPFNDDAVIELSATLRKDRAQHALDSKQAIDAVRAWLARHSDELDMVIWLARDPGGEGAGGLFHFITFKDSGRPGTLGYAAQQLLDGVLEPGRQAMNYTIVNGADVQKMLEDLALRIATAKRSVDASLTPTGKPGTLAKPANAPLSPAARAYVEQLIDDAARMLSAVRGTAQAEKTDAPPTTNGPGSPRGNPKPRLHAAPRPLRLRTGDNRRPNRRTGERPTADTIP